MLTSNLDQQELNRRADEVFDLKVGDFIYDIYIDDDDKFVVSMSEYDLDAEDDIDFKYLPDMTDRPEARDYLLGLRDDFNDWKRFR